MRNSVRRDFIDMSQAVQKAFVRAVYNKTLSRTTVQASHTHNNTHTHARVFYQMIFIDF
jgi:hypothetical protein